MKGFDPKFKTFPDYIIGITHQIWEGRRIHTLHDYYSKDIIVRSPGSLVVGNEGVIAATMATLQEFPDRQLLGEEVIWSGTPETGLLSSHRIVSTATHTGFGVFGAPTGAKLVYRIHADCHAKENTIDDEWLIRDQGAIVRQLGLEPKQYATDLIVLEGGPHKCIKPLCPGTDQPGPYTGKGNENEWGARHAELLKKIMSAEMSAVPAEYDRGCCLQLPGGVSEHGTRAADQFWMGLRSAFPSAQFSIDHQIGMDGDGFSPRSAIRWSLFGKHDGWGIFGPPTGVEVYVLGISHAEFGPRGLRREYTLFDETAIWKQIIMHTGEGL